MEQKWETVTGAMLVEKRAWFEVALKVPESEKLWSDGWVQIFLRTYVGLQNLADRLTHNYKQI